MTHSVRALIAAVWVVGVALSCLAGPAEAALVSAYVVPHGGIFLDPTHAFNTSTSAHRLHAAGCEMGRMVAADRPDLIILSTPHGLAEPRDMLLYSASGGSGRADTEGNYVGWRMSPEMDTKVIPGLMDAARKATPNVTTLAMGGDDDTVRLGAGEVIPLLFVKDSVRVWRDTVEPARPHPTCPAGPRPARTAARVAVVSHPTRRLDHSVEMIEEYLRLGRAWREHLDSRPERIVFIVSSDLAHTHRADGPYGYSAAAAPFDAACGRWAATLDGDALLKEAAKLVYDAKSCGYTGMVLLHGMLTEGRHPPFKVDGVVLARGAPSYYGMMVAAFRGLSHGK